MPKVFILSDGGHDYSPAKHYGELVFCTDEIIRRDDVAHMFRVLRVALADAEPGDFLLISSLSSMCAVAASILSYQFGELHLLGYKDGHYVQRDLVLEEP